MSNDVNQLLLDLGNLLSRKTQMWLLGAGISKKAGVPLMGELTELIENTLDEAVKQDYRDILKRLKPGANVEDVLTRIGDRISIAESSPTEEVEFGENRRSSDQLSALHENICQALQEVIRRGYTSDNGDLVVADEPILDVSDHLTFVRTLFERTRAGAKKGESPVAFFTTNYDTLLEDALALAEVPTTDGFSGGTMAYWNPEDDPYDFREPFSPTAGVRAKLYKLHGSIDWYSSPSGVVVRRRERASYPSAEESRLLVYPQTTKYQSTQRAPFADLFRAFRSALFSHEHTVLTACGYGFADRHINDEIEKALKREANDITLLAFVKEATPKEGAEPPDEPLLPSILLSWLRDEGEWAEDVIVVTDRGYYHGNLENQFPGPYEWPLWSYQGLIEFLKDPDSIEVSCLE